MGLLEKNLRILGDLDKTLAQRVEHTPVAAPIEVVPAKSGRPTMKADGFAMHSAYDPVKEAELQVQKFLEGDGGEGGLYVLGLGLGYHVDALIGRGIKPIILVEPSLELFRKALEEVDMERAGFFSLESSICFLRRSTLPVTRPVTLARNRPLGRRKQSPMPRSAQAPIMAGLTPG